MQSWMHNSGRKEEKKFFGFIFLIKNDLLLPYEKQ